MAQFLARRAAIDVLAGVIHKILLAKSAFCYGPRRYRLWQRYSDASLFAGEDFLTVEIAPVRNGVELLNTQRFFGLGRHGGKLARGRDLHW